MKKLKLLIVIIFVSIITSGCTLNYNLTIKDDRSILESVVVTEKNSILEKKYDNYKKEINEKQRFYKEHQIYTEYSSSKIFNKDESGLKLTKEFKYGTFNNSQNKTSVFNSYSFYEEGNNYVFRLSYPVKEALFPDTRDSEKIDKAYINIKSHLKVIDSNSDSYDEKTKVYTWKLDDDFFNNNEGIYLKISKDRDMMLIIKDLISNNLNIVVSVITSITILLLVILYIYRKYKNGMKI